MVPGESFAYQHQVVVCKTRIKVRKRKMVKTEQKIQGRKLKERERCEDFSEEIRVVLGHVEEFPADLKTTATVTQSARYFHWTETGRQKDLVVG